MDQQHALHVERKKNKRRRIDLNLAVASTSVDPETCRRATVRIRGSARGQGSNRVFQGVQSAEFRESVERITAGLKDFCPSVSRRGPASKVVSWTFRARAFL